jgi:flagellar motor switch protein FliM
MPIRAELAAGQATFQQLEQMQVGDTIKLDTEIDEPTLIYIDDEPKFVGRPGRVGRKNAVQIISPIEPLSEEIHKNRSRPVPYLDQ